MSHTWKNWNRSWGNVHVFISQRWMWHTIRLSSHGYMNRFRFSACADVFLVFARLLKSFEPKNILWIKSGVIVIFYSWINLRKGVSVLVIGGCTTTSCVRVSSTEIASQLGEQGLAGKVRLVVDLNLCGARNENFQKTADSDPVLVQIYGRDFCHGKSAVDLAIVQMKRAGVEILEGTGWDWWSCTSWEQAQRNY